MVLIAEVIKATKRSPTLRQLSELMGSPRTSSQPYVSGLILRGLLVTVGKPGQARNLRLTDTGEKMVRRIKTEK